MSPNGGSDQSWSISRKIEETSIMIKPNSRVVAYRASTPQVRGSILGLESPMTSYARRHGIVTETKMTCVARQLELLSEYSSSVHCIAYSYKYLIRILKWKAKVTLTTSFRQIEKENTMVVIVILMK
ncbi:hypothetical protein TNCV_4995961 [Trichonephila clavipes]|nr:hypothetical protein TNCV_4995961 [Trichonephila clavipes]